MVIDLPIRHPPVLKDVGHLGGRRAETKKINKVHQLFLITEKSFLPIIITIDSLLFYQSLNCVHDVFMMCAKNSRKKLKKF